VTWSIVRFGRAEPIAWKASLLGAKMVTSERPLTASTRSAAVRAPASEVRFAAMAVVETFGGRVRTVSMTWTTPPVMLTS
jgi:hypothetical protein